MALKKKNLLRHKKRGSHSLTRREMPKQRGFTWRFFSIWSLSIFSVTIVKAGRNFQRCEFLSHLIWIWERNLWQNLERMVQRRREMKQTTRTLYATLQLPESNSTKSHVLSSQYQVQKITCTWSLFHFHQRIYTERGADRLIFSLSSCKRKSQRHKKHNRHKNTRELYYRESIERERPSHTGLLPPYCSLLLYQPSFPFLDHQAEIIIIIIKVIRPRWSS